MIAQSVMRAFHRLVVLLRSLREISREARPAALARQMIPDVAYGLRLFRKAQAFSATCVLIIALGIAATTAIFSVVHGVALRPLPRGVSYGIDFVAAALGAKHLGASQRAARQSD